MESLEDSDSVLGLRSAKRMGLTTIDLSDPNVKRRLLEHMLSNIYGEAEIDYHTRLVKYRKQESNEGEGSDELR